MSSCPMPDQGPLPGRVLVLDLLRVLAALQMVQGHTIDALLAPGARHGALHAGWLASRGLTSVTFLFVAGLAYGAGRLGGGEPRRPVGARLLRAGGLLALGYALHLPIGLLGGPSPLQTASLVRAAFAVDILQCMGVSLLVLELLGWALARPARLRWACASLALSLLGAAPFAWQLEPRGALLPWFDYLSPRAGSLFPLLPWAAHLFAGVALSRWLLADGLCAARFAIAAAVALAVGGVLRASSATLLADHVGRLGWVLAAGAILSAVRPRAAAYPRWLLRLPRETLFIYVSHVLIVYGDGVGLGTWVGRTLGPWAALAVSLLVIGVSFTGALWYRSLLDGVRTRHDSTRAALAGSAATG